MVPSNSSGFPMSPPGEEVVHQSTYHSWTATAIPGVPCPPNRHLDSAKSAGQRGNIMKIMGILCGDVLDASSHGSEVGKKTLVISGHCPTYPIEITRVVTHNHDPWDEPPSSI